jgi:hypothetical protein
MSDLGPILYVLAGILVVLFWHRVRGQSFDDMFERSRRDHDRVHRVNTKHPQGGSWSDHEKWLREEA